MRQFWLETSPNEIHMFLGRLLQANGPFPWKAVSQLPALLATGENFENCGSQPWVTS
jgi:hypothetical protein